MVESRSDFRPLFAGRGSEFGEGLKVDFCNPSSVSMHWRRTLVRLWSEFGPEHELSISQEIDYFLGNRLEEN